MLATLKLKKGDIVLLNVPENPRLHNAKGKIQRLTEWGAFVKTSAAATGQFRALFSELILAHETNGSLKEKGYTGDVCDVCNGCHMTRNGSCVKCQDCGNSNGCS